MRAPAPDPAGSGPALARHEERGGNMKFDPILPAARVQAMRTQGYWGDELLLDHLDRSIAQAPDKTAIVDFNSMQGAGHRLSYREFGNLVDRIAVGLAELGIEKNDVVSANWPTWGGSARRGFPFCGWG